MAFVHLENVATNDDLYATYFHAQGPLARTDLAVNANLLLSLALIDPKAPSCQRLCSRLVHALLAREYVSAHSSYYLSELWFLFSLARALSVLHRHVPRPVVNALRQAACIAASRPFVSRLEQALAWFILLQSNEPFRPAPTDSYQDIVPADELLTFAEYSDTPLGRNP